MATWLKQSTAVEIGMGPFVDNADGNTIENTLTITQPDIRLKKNGGAWAQKNAAQTLSHEENGWYEVALDTTDTNTLGILIVAIHESGALPVWREFMVVPANVYDSMIDGSDNLQVDTVQIEGADATNTIGSSVPSAAAIADAVWDEVLTGASHNDATSAGRRLRQLSAVSVSFAGTIDGTPSSTVIPLDSSASTTNDFYKPGLAIIESSFGTQFARVESYNGSTKELTLASALSTTPNNGDLVTISPWASVRVSDIDGNPLDDISDAVLDGAIEGAVTFRQSVRGQNAALLGKASGLETTNPVYRDLADSKDRIDATADSFGNRTAVTLDLT